MNPYVPLVTGFEGLVRGLLGQAPLILAALIAIVVFIGLAVLVRRLTHRMLLRYDRTLAEMGGQLGYAVTVMFGILVALWIAIPTINFREIFAGLGVTGLILGFALKDLLENFAAGVLILWRRPFKLDDQIRSGTYEGTVVEINFRSTVLRTYDGLKVYIPNGRVFTEAVENLTGFRTRRSMITLGIDQTASVSQARQVILETLAQLGPAGVLPDPPPVVFLHAIGDFANELHVLYWTSPPTRFSELTTRSEVTERLASALQAAGVGFPYPIRTVYLERHEVMDGASDGRSDARVG